MICLKRPPTAKILLFSFFYLFFFVAGRGPYPKHRALFGKKTPISIPFSDPPLPPPTNPLKMQGKQTGNCFDIIYIINPGGFFLFWLSVTESNIIFQIAYLN